MRGWAAGGVRRKNTGEGNERKNARNREEADCKSLEVGKGYWGSCSAGVEAHLFPFTHLSTSPFNAYFYTFAFILFCFNLILSYLILTYFDNFVAESLNQRLSHECTCPTRVMINTLNLESTEYFSYRIQLIILFMSCTQQYFTIQWLFFTAV